MTKRAHVDLHVQSSKFKIHLLPMNVRLRMCTPCHTQTMGAIKTRHNEARLSVMPHACIFHGTGTASAPVGGLSSVRYARTESSISSIFLRRYAAVITHASLLASAVQLVLAHVNPGKPLSSEDKYVCPIFDAFGQGLRMDVTSV